MNNTFEDTDFALAKARLERQARQNAQTRYTLVKAVVLSAFAHAQHISHIVNEDEREMLLNWLRQENEHLTY